MKIRCFAAKLFLGMALLSGLVGVVQLVRYAPHDLHLAPLLFLMIPGLIPFSVAMLSACFGLAYLALEWKFKRSASATLAVAQLILFLLATLGHSIVIRFWWRVLGEEQATGLSVPVWSALLSAGAFTASLVVFVANIVWSMRRPLQKA